MRTAAKAPLAGVLVLSVGASLAGACGGSPKTQSAGTGAAGGAAASSSAATGAGGTGGGDGDGGAACPVSSSQPTVVLAGGAAGGPNGIAVDAASVYWISTGHAVVACPIGGCNGAPATLAPQPDPGTFPHGIAADGASVYWTTDNPTSGGTVMECAAQGCGGKPTVLVPASATESATGPIAVDATGVSWSQLSAEATVNRSDKNGGNPVVLAAGQNVGALAVDGMNVYWIHDLSDEVLSCAAGGCNGNPTVLAENQLASALAADGTNV